jgi:hypothetical protein
MGSPPVRKTGALGAETSREVRRVLYDGDGAVALASRDRSAWAVRCKWSGNSCCSRSVTTRLGRAEFAAQCTGALRVRGWDGDQELADAVDAARGIAASDPRPLKEILVDLEQLADLIRRHPRIPARRMTRIALSAPTGAQRQLHCAKSCRIEPASAHLPLPRTTK